MERRSRLARTQLLLLSWPYLGTGKGAAVPERRLGSSALGRGHIHLPAKDVLSLCQVLQERHPSPGAPRQDLESRFLAGNLGAGPAGLPGPLPSSFCSLFPYSQSPGKNLRLRRRRSW